MQVHYAGCALALNVTDAVQLRSLVVYERKEQSVRQGCRICLLCVYWTSLNTLRHEMLHIHRLYLCRLVIVFDPGNSSIELAGTIHSSVVPAESG